MDNRYYDNVIDEMRPFLDEQNFTESDGGFYNDKIKFAVVYDEDKQTYSLLTAVKDDDGNFTEMTAVNTWLFDDSQTASDAGSVGIDFVMSLKKELGIRSKRTADGAVELPSATKSGAMTVTGFTKKMLDVFPVLKDDYKAHVAVYGNFLYINFFGDHLVPQLKLIFESGTKKQIKKIYDVFEDAYVKGDKDTVNIMLAVMAAAAYNNEKIGAAIEEMLKEDSHFLQSYRNLSAVLPKSKKLFSALVK